MILVQKEDFNVAEEYAAIRDSDHTEGAIVMFSGLVRDFSGDGLITGLELEHYPGMTEKVLAEIEIEAHRRWDLNSIRIIHRYGALALGDQIVFVAVSSAHRGAAFEANQFIMDILKTQAPFWKKEMTRNGDFWVEAKEKDEKANDNYHAVPRRNELWTSNFRRCYRNRYSIQNQRTHLGCPCLHS